MREYWESSKDECTVLLVVCRQNILLDENMSGKVADFGIVTALPTTVGSTTLFTAAATVALAGTRGYMPPEFADGKRGVRSDVYSYGVVSFRSTQNFCLLSAEHWLCNLSRR